ncbi:metallophosphoesterase [Pseudomonas oryzihabitans]|uniref:metallophosphoesterase family protein n=1 Tax=Pseudomonas oryzihabitans TaxID=47885 RepID=UPI0028948349|nr:metallophosphoesterase [Pseudomonas oryzihabitans]MDT3722135.1 metallophosphoesterase [Pseudomonas oryzihabitans]
MTRSTDFLAFAHIGDLHLTTADADNARDLRTILQRLRERQELDFVFLPGDNADNGTAEQYRLLRQALADFTLPVAVITGDHDMEGGDLGPFYAELQVPRSPYAKAVGDVRCLFLDMCGPGGGGPDFRLGAEQVQWLERELLEASRQERQCVVFMHSYPADLRGPGEAERVARLLHEGPVRLVEIGHTHYNELAHDGGVLYAACRSSGQIEEGGVGFALVTLDGPAVSWRFRESREAWPWVQITAPGDARLNGMGAVEASECRVLVLAEAELTACEWQCDEGPWWPLVSLGKGRYRGDRPVPAGARRLQVRVRDARGGEDRDQIELTGPQRPLAAPADWGSDRTSLGEWQAKGVLGTQLGPNRNGRKW